MYPPGREALLKDPTVTPALHQVAAEGWREESQHHAQAALAALADRSSVQRDANDKTNANEKHVMLSYQWDVQPVAKRIVHELQVRRYRTWFGERSTVKLANMARFQQLSVLGANK